MQRGRQAQKQQPYAHLQLQRTAAGLALLRSRAAEPGHGSGVTCSPAQAPAECWRGPRPDPGLTPPRDAGAGGALAGLGALTLTAPPPFCAAGAGGVLAGPAGRAPRCALPAARGGLCGGAGRAPEVPAAHLPRLPRQRARAPPRAGRRGASAGEPAHPGAVAVIESARGHSRRHARLHLAGCRQGALHHRRANTGRLPYRRAACRPGACRARSCRRRSGSAPAGVPGVARAAVAAGRAGGGGGRPGRVRRPPPVRRGRRCTPGGPRLGRVLRARRGGGGLQGALR